MIARYGARKLSFRDVAEEAGVSKALISYYFSGRNDLLARAYEFSDDRARERVSDAFEPVESGAVRLSRVLALYLTDDPNMQEDWILWSELSSAAMFEPDLRPVMEASFVRWTDWIRGLVRDAVEEGSIDIGADADKTTLRLVALTDGLGSLLARGLIEREAAREVLAQHLDASLGRTSRSSTEGSSRAEPPAIGYMRLLAYQLQNAVEQLEGLASTSAERDAIQTVTELIRSRTGQHSMNTPSGERLNKHAERPPLS
ncbi:MAG: TetR family transcriptional regulator [Chloroflexi bacterium]|nr:TetR family transcriptional regulator [Chloroflexota bacterium]